MGKNKKLSIFESTKAINEEQSEILQPQSIKYKAILLLTIAFDFEDD